MSGLAYQLGISLRLHLRNKMGLLYSYLFPAIFLVAFWVLYDILHDLDVEEVLGAIVDEDDAFGPRPFFASEISSSRDSSGMRHICARYMRIGSSDSYGSPWSLSGPTPPASGRGTAALNAFEEFRMRAQRELDVTPALETRRLAIDIAAALGEADAVTPNAMQKEAAVITQPHAQVRRVAFGNPRAVRWAVATGMVSVVAAVALYGAQSRAVRAESEVPALAIAMPVLEGGARAQHADFVRNLPALISARLAADAPITVVSGARASTQRGTLHLGSTVYSDGDGTRAEFVLRDDAGTVLRAFRQKLDVARGWDHAVDQVSNTVRKEVGAQ